MKTSNHILLYDDYCPLCVWYSGLFVKYKLLDPTNRQPFSTANEKLLSLIDFEKGRNEIPLIDQTNGTVTYGLDALLILLGKSFPFIKKAGNIQPVYWFLRKLYKFISLNRKVIVAKKCHSGSIDCSPEFNISYRLLLPVVAVLAVFLSAGSVHHSILSRISFYTASYTQLQIAAALFITIMYASAFLLRFHKAIECIGQVSVVILIGLLLYWPVLLLNTLITIPGWILFLYIVCIILIMGKEYFRRMRYIDNYTKEFPVLIAHLSAVLCFLYGILITR